ncbi:hypothetical protein [Microbulbifer discodermiae]|uniref:hypothetical protein n=1 Tax=Microbulbifer sp. 2201CG32-9 TaxID=3232309 RepID=UPI00345BFCCB
MDPIEQPDTKHRPRGQFQRSGGAVTEESGLWERTKDAFTGEEKMTPEMESVQEIGAAPELNQLSVPAFKASLGLLASGDDKSLRGILREQFGESVTFEEDARGNTIVNMPSGSYALNRPGLSAQDAIRGVFNMLAFTPAGRATSVTGAVAKNAMTETALQGVEKGLGGQGIRAGEVALAGGLGGAFKVGENAISTAYRAVKGSPKNELVEAAATMQVPVMTSDIYKPKTWASKAALENAEKIPVLGTGGLREKQQHAREAAVEQLASKYGEFSFDAIVDSLNVQKDRMKRAAGNVLSTIGSKLDTAGHIPLYNTFRSIDAAVAELGRKGVIQSSSAMDDLESLMAILKEAPQSFTTLKENRTAFREIINSADRAERSQLTSRAKALLQRVGSAMKQDMDAFARRNLSSTELVKWTRANSVYAEEAQKLTRSRLKHVLDRGDVTPESVGSLLFSRKPSEVELLYKSLTPTGRANARAAVISKVITDLGRQGRGVSPNAFVSEMKKYGYQVDIFFKGREKAELRGLLKALEATKRAQEASVTTPTGQQVLGAAGLGAAVIDLGATIGSAGTLGRLAALYESGPVRNALLRLDSLPRGSTAFEHSVYEFFSNTLPLAQTARRGISDTEPPPTGQQGQSFP